MNTSMFVPDYTHLTGLLKHLNAEELKAILNNDDKAEEMIKDLKQIKDIEAEKEMLLASNRSISEYNLSKKSVIQEHKKELENSYNRALELKSNLLHSKQEIENKHGLQSKDTILALLQAATSEIDDEAESTVDVFLKNEISVEYFLEKYLELRKLAHLRRIKSEKLAKMLQEGNGIVTPPARPHRLRKPPPPPVPTSSMSPNTCPYPSPPNVSPYPSQPNQKLPIVPARHAPSPPLPQYPNQFSANSTSFPVAGNLPYPAAHQNQFVPFPYYSR